METAAWWHQECLDAAQDNKFAKLLVAFMSRLLGKCRESKRGIDYMHHARQVCNAMMYTLMSANLMTCAARASLITVATPVT